MIETKEIYGIECVPCYKHFDDKTPKGYVPYELWRQLKKCGEPKNPKEKYVKDGRWTAVPPKNEVEQKLYDNSWEYLIARKPRKEAAAAGTAQKTPTKLQRELILRAPSTIKANLMRCGVTGQELENSVKWTIDTNREAAKEFGLVQELAQVLEGEGWLY